MQRDGVHRAARGRGGRAGASRVVVPGDRPPGPAPARRQRHGPTGEQQETASAGRAGVLRLRCPGRLAGVGFRRAGIDRRVGRRQRVLDVRQRERCGRALGDQPGDRVGQPVGRLSVLRSVVGRQFPHQFPGVRPPGRILLQAAAQHVQQTRRHPVEVRRVVHGPVQQCVDRSTAERRPAGRSERQDTPEGEHVARRADAVPTTSLGLLGRQIAGRADHHPGRRERPVLRCPGDTEVDEPRPVMGDQHIARLQVPVHQTGPVHLAQRLRQPGAEQPQSALGQRPVRGHRLAQRRAGDERRRQPRCLGVRVGVRQRNHPGVVDPSGHLDLTAEPLLEARLLGVLGEQHLQRHQGAARRARQVHHSHASGAEAAEQAMVRDTRGIGRTQRLHQFPTPSSDFTRSSIATRACDEYCVNSSSE